jgi:hypothetical protein
VCLWSLGLASETGFRIESKFAQPTDAAVPLRCLHFWATSLIRAIQIGTAPPSRDLWGDFHLTSEAMRWPWLRGPVPLAAGSDLVPLASIWCHDFEVSDVAEGPARQYSRAVVMPLRQTAMTSFVCGQSLTPVAPDLLNQARVKSSLS